MNKIAALLDSVGLRPKTDAKVQEHAPVDTYDVKDLKKLTQHRDFLRSLKADEDERLKLLESKTSQLFSQTGLILAVMSLFIPLILDKVELTGVRIAFLMVLFVACFFYVLTIHNSAKTLNIRKYKYQRLRAEDVLDFADTTEARFCAEEVQGLLSSLRANVELNNQKGTNLLRSYRSFWIANVVTAFLSLSLCISLIIFDRKKESVNVRIENLPEVQNQSATNNQAEKVELTDSFQQAASDSNQEVPESNTNSK